MEAVVLSSPCGIVEQHQSIEFHGFRCLSSSLQQSGVEGHAFYDLRRTFQTIAEEHSRDIVAIRALMGHVDFSMTGVYRQRINDARLIAVVNIMDRWMQGAIEGNGIA